MQLTLPPEIQKIIDDRVRSGRYRSSDEVVAAAVANLSRQDRFEELNSADLARVFPDIKTQLAEGLESARAGRLVDGEAFFDDLEQNEEGHNPTNRKTA